MAMIKTPQEIAILREGGALLSRTLREVRARCVAGASTQALDALARQRLSEAGGTPSFLGYRIGENGPAFPGALCISINEEVVHGLPVPDRKIRDGDIVGLDIGVWWKGLCTDMATTVIVGTVDPRVSALVRDTRSALAHALDVLGSGKSIFDIGASIEDDLEPKGYGIVRDLVGHGVGHAVHEEPQIPNYRESRMRRVFMRTGMVIAIEPMVTLGSREVLVKDDGWTIVTADGSPSAHVEVTVAITDHGYELITPWPDEKAHDGG